MIRRIAVAAGVVPLLVLAGCSGDANAGGDTTCADYREMSGSEQTEVIKKFLSDKGGEPSNGEITLNKLSAKTYCATVGKDSDPIRNIDG